MCKTKQESKAIIDAEWLATEVASIIFNQGKAKVFNVLESQLEPGTRLGAAKRLTEDVISNIARDSAHFIKDVLGDWQDEVIPGPEVDLTPEEIKEIESDYQKIEQIIE